MGTLARRVNKVCKEKAKSYSIGEYDSINEADTDNALVKPFLNAFGWNTENLKHVSSQKYLNSKEIPDYVLKSDGTIRIVIEVKKAGSGLSEHIPQLEKYFNDSSAHIGILTNGIQYWLFSWARHENYMNNIPYAIIDIRDLRLDKEDSFMRYFRQDVFNATYFKWFSHADYTYGQLYGLMGNSVRDNPKDKRLAKKVFFSIFSKYSFSHINPQTAQATNTTRAIRLTHRQILSLYQFVQYHSRWNYRHNNVRVNPMI